MDGKNVLVDTNVIVNLINGHRTAAEILQDRNLHFSFITEIELLSFQKLTSKEEAVIKELLLEGVIFQSDSEIITRAILIRKQNSLEVPGAIIAATAQRYNIPLISSDKHMTKVKNLKLLQF